MNNPRVLIVATSQKIDLTAATTLWMQELGQPYFTFKDFTDDIVLTSPDGIKISIAETGEEPDEQKTYKELNDREKLALAWIRTAVPIHNLRASDFDLLYIAGGNNCIYDMEHCKHLTAMLEAFIADEKPFAAIGLGVTALTSLFLPDGTPFVRGRKLTSYTNREVLQNGLEKTMPFSLESRLITYGAAYSSNASNRANIVIDGRLITAQNESASTMAVFALRNLFMTAVAAC